MNWNTIVIVICILTGVFAVWREYGRNNKSRLGWRVLVIVLAIIALACIALPVSYQKDAALQDKHEAVLLTNGFDADSLPKYNSNLFTTNRQIKSKYPKAKLLNNVNEIVNDLTIKQLLILGDGLEERQLQQLNDLPVIFYPKEFKQGITAISWNEKLRAGDELSIQGRYKNSSAQKTKLVLKGLSTNIDSVEIAANSQSAFELKTVPKNAGKAIYTLTAICGKDTLEQENIPLQIYPVNPLKVLMLTASPDFESRFLKNWLAGNGYAVAVRSAISKDKFNKEFINTEQFPLDHLTTGLLSKFDLLLGDLSVLKSLNNAEATALKTEVTQKGIGLIVRADSTLHSGSWLQNDFPLDRLAGKDSLPTTLIIEGRGGKTLPITPGRVYINYQNNTQPLITDERGHILAGATLNGSGKLIFTPLNNTFSWMLAGNKKDYTALWSLLIHEAARKTPATENWEVLTGIPSVYSPVKLQLQSASQAASVKVEEAGLAFGQDVLLPFEHTATYWPQGQGWQQAKQTTGAQSWWYAYGTDDWKSLQTLKKQADTRNYMARHTIVNNVTKQIHQKLRIAVPKIYFYVLLLLACTFLWVEAKFS